MPDAARPDPPAGALEDAVAALEEATASLRGAGARTAADERERYLRRLEERGALADVDESTDLSALPPGVTHVRHPDGHVERLGYS
ncbi:hypothetical protein [Pseudonocardia lacus]|uniref:hypothetical protein n=1 Tax=Pseudonocardia lacus TaxID=2835865 RepID=UPI001BDCF511|nr:hypothetical protein [Pseudonocardia lacus]